MKILLTGGAGYIGIHTAVELCRCGYDVVIADNYFNSTPEAVKRAEKLTERTIPVYETDVSDKNALRAVFETEGIDGVIHFAGYKAVGDSVKYPVSYYRNNINTTLAVLDIMEEFGVRFLIFSSSATVYGVPKKTPISETDGRGMCTNPYGWTKWMIEQIIADAAAARPELSAVLLRYFNPIGAHPSGVIGENPNGVPNNLMPYITQVAVGKRDHLNVFGNDYKTHDGTGVRDYIHVVDIARGHVKAIDYCRKIKGTDVINLGTGIGYSVLDIVHSFERVNDIKIPYVIAPRRPGDIDELYSDPSKAADILGWKAEYGIEDMCRDSWNWQKNNPDGYQKK